MNLIPEIICGTIVGTSLMTGFSYLMSEQFRKRFQEPRLLEYVMKLSGAKLSDRSKEIAAWIIHYLIGLLFVLAYYFIWNCCLAKSWTITLLFGAISGIIGILGWIVIFSIPDDKPHVSFTSYFIQLFFAHIIFAFGVFMTDRLLSLIR
jgi:hypothetical protein